MAILYQIFTLLGMLSVSFSTVINAPLIDETPRAIPIRIMKENRAIEQQIEAAQAQAIVRDALRTELGSRKYKEVVVFIVPSASEEVQSPVLLAYLKLRDSFGVVVVRITLDADMRVRSIEWDVTPESFELESGAIRAGTCPDDTIEALFATPLDQNPMVANIKKAAASSSQAGFNTKILTGNEATVNAYRNWLACKNLVVLGNISHGNTSCIILSDGRLTSEYFNQLPSNALNRKILFFNSCQVHNAPLEPALVKAGVVSFIGGNVNLKVGVAGDVFTSFWDDVLKHKPMSLEPTLRKYEDQLYGSSNAYGISGQGEMPWSSQPDNSPPVAKAQTVSTTENTDLSITLSASDADSDVLTYSIEEQPAHGMLFDTVPKMVYRPDSGFVGTDHFTFRANDGVNDSNLATITIRVKAAENQAPISEDQSLTAPSGIEKHITLKANDSDGDTLTFSIVSQPVFGALSGKGPQLVYTSDADYVGMDSFTFKAYDGSSYSNEATVSVNVVSNDSSEPSLPGCSTGSLPGSVFVSLFLIGWFMRRSKNCQHKNV